MSLARVGDSLLDLSAGSCLSHTLQTQDGKEEIGVQITAAGP